MYDVLNSKEYVNYVYADKTDISRKDLQSTYHKAQSMLLSKLEQDIFQNCKNVADVLNLITNYQNTFC